jgi:polyisoprenoid-binding protein YceI
MKNLFNVAMLFAFAGLFAVSCNQAPKGEKVETTDTKEVEKVEEAKTLNLDSASAVIEWKGTKAVGKGHNGTIALKSGSLQIKGNEVVGGSFILNMKSIACTDLKGGEKSALEKHLKEKDFFEVEKFAEGKFEITSVKAEAKDGSTHSVEGNLTLKDKSHGVKIPATIKVENGEATITTPDFNINRQDWGINYKIAVKDGILNDQIGLKISLKAK